MTANLAKIFSDSDESVPAVAAIVRKPTSGENHWDVVDGCLLIHCVTKGHQQPLWAHASGATRLGRGLLQIPDLGTEVLISFDMGLFEGDAFIVGLFGRSVSDGLAENVTLLLDDKVRIKSVGGTSVPLGTLPDLQALRDVFTNWVVAPNDGGAALKALLTTLIAGPPVWPAGTTVLEGE